MKILNFRPGKTICLSNVQQYFVFQCDVQICQTLTIYKISSFLTNGSWNIIETIDVTIYSLNV